MSSSDNNNNNNISKKCDYNRYRRLEIPLIVIVATRKWLLDKPRGLDLREGEFGQRKTIFSLTFKLLASFS